jgi:small subunit ribosomal protein S2
VVAAAVADGLMARAGASQADEKPADDTFSATGAVDEPLPEWERDLLAGGPADAAATETEEVQESAVSDPAEADAEIAEVAPDVAEIAAAAAAEATPEAAEAAAEEAAEEASENSADAVVAE